MRGSKPELCRARRRNAILKPRERRIRVSTDCRRRASSVTRMTPMPPGNTQVYAGLSDRALKSVPLSALAPLTPRQAEVLGWIAAGKRKRGNAKMLRCSKRTGGKNGGNIMGGLHRGKRSGAGGGAKF